MGRGEQPPLMMDPANCSLAQVSGTWYLLPKMKKKKRKNTPPPITATSFPDGSCVSVYQM